MRAQIGDRLVMRRRRAGGPPRRAQILEVQGPDGTPPFRVRWEHDGRSSVVVPGPDAMLEPGARAGETPSARPGPPSPPKDVIDPELRLMLLEESTEAIGWQLERLREEVRALAAAAGT